MTGRFSRLRARTCTRWLAVCAVTLLFASRAPAPLHGQTFPTSCLNFADDPLVAGMPIRAVHFTELRTCIDALRVSLGVSPYVWSEPIVPGVTVRALHLTEMRTALSAVYVGTGMTAPAWVEAITPEATFIQAAHLMELRAKARALDLPQAATPEFMPGAGAYPPEPTLYVSATSATPGATVRYTTDGTVPTITSPVLTGHQVFPSATLTARAFGSGRWPSASAAASYVLQVVPPSFSIVGGDYDLNQEITLSGGPFDLVRYTTDGSIVTEASPQFIGTPIILQGPLTVRARAYRSPYAPSVEVQQTYTPLVATPTMSPEAGQYQTLPLVALSTATSGATIRYTLDRTDPTDTSPIYTGHIVTQNFTSIRASAYKGGWAPSAVAVATYWDFTPPETSGVSAVLSGTNPALPAAVGGTVSFAVSGGTMTTDPDSVFAYRNGTRVTGTALQISAAGVTLPNVLVDGENRLELEALDQTGLVFYDAATVWAGSRMLTVTVRRRQDGTVVSGASVTARLQRAGAVSAAGTTNGSGQVAVASLPASHEVGLVVTAPGFRAGEVTVGATATAVTVDLDEATRDFGTLAGWSVQTPRAWTQPHSEASTPLVPCPDCLGHGGTFDPQQRLVVAGDGSGDQDLVIDTKNLYGGQTVTRTIAVEPGTSQVTARFRFQTDEMWWALPGRSFFPHYDDWFQVRLQPVGRPSEAVTFTRSVSQLLNAGQLNSHAATPWYTLSLPTQFTDAVEVTFTVANAVTNGHLSILFADVVQETTHRIAAVELRDLIDANDTYQADREAKVLSALSLSPMPIGLVSYDGHIRVNGTLRIEGPEHDTLTDVWLEVWDNELKVATAPLARTTSSTVRSQLLNVEFGLSGVLEVAELSPGIAPVLFEFEAANLSSVNQVTDYNTLVLQIHAKRSNGADLGVFIVKNDIAKLVTYPSASVGRTGTSRDLGDCAGLTVTTRPEQRFRRHNPPFPCGGDGWALPSTITWAQSNRLVPFEGGSVAIGWNDFSNMNGGFFAGHSGHREGRTIDGIFPGYLNRDAKAAKILLAWLNSIDVSKIERIYVGFSTSTGCSAVPVDPATNRFYQEINGKQLADGRQATAVIRNQAMHCDHFDILLRRIVQ